MHGGLIVHVHTHTCTVHTVYMYIIYQLASNFIERNFRDIFKIDFLWCTMKIPKF